MNGTRPSEGRIEWTTKSLNFSLPIMQSIKQLANSAESMGKLYQKDTVRDSGLLFDEIRGKFGVWSEEVEMATDYDPNFYCLPADEVLACKSPSVQLNTSYTHVHAYICKQYTKIIEDIKVITSEDHVFDDNDANELDEELNF